MLLYKGLSLAHDRPPSRHAPIRLATAHEIRHGSSFGVHCSLKARVKGRILLPQRRRGRASYGVEGHNAVDLVALLLPPLRHDGPPFLFLS